MTISNSRRPRHPFTVRPAVFTASLWVATLLLGVWALPALAQETAAQETAVQETAVQETAVQEPAAQEPAAAAEEPALDLSAALRLVFVEPKPTAAELPNLLEQIEQNPDNTETRLRLISYYRPFEPTQRRSWEGHLRWLLEKHPEEAGTAQLTRSLVALPQDEVTKLTKRLWLEQVERFPNDPRVQANAATFFSLHDRELAEKLLENAKALEPKNPQWSRQLAQMFQHGGLGGDTVGAARKALAELESAVPNMPEEERQAALPQLAKYAFDAEANKKAKAYAEEMIVLAGGESNWNTGNLFHHGHIVLGRLALRADDVATAKAHLLDAARTGGSPQLGSFGPNMSLAKELLERDERDAVLEYLALCGDFWTHGKDRLSGWKKQIQSGSMPDFGPNLIY